MLLHQARQRRSITARRAGIRGQRQLHFAIDNATHTFDQATRLLVFLTQPDHVRQRHARAES